MIKKGKYKILEYDGCANLIAVKVLNVYETVDGQIVEYRYNYPFPITKQQYAKDFERRIATEI